MIRLGHFHILQWPPTALKNKSKLFTRTHKALQNQEFVYFFSPISYYHFLLSSVNFSHIGTLFLEHANLVLALGLCTYCSLPWECPALDHLVSFHIIHGSAQMSLPQKSLPI